MQEVPDTQRVLRTAAWMWIGYLAALVVVDVLIYPPAPRIQTGLYYWGNGLAALLFLGLSFWDWARIRLKEAFLPLMILLISGAPILLHHTLVPRFPPGPLSNAEGMALRQLPVLFIGLALTAWRYELAHVLLFSISTAAFEMGVIIVMGRVPANMLVLFFFITLVRTVSFILVGLFINRLMSRLREQGESLKHANAQVIHYASTLEKLTVSRERNRMAREMHDILAHTLTGLSVTLETMKAYWEVDPVKVRELLDKSLDSTRTGLEETRRALKSLRASPLEDLGLGLALRKMAGSIAARANLALEIDLPEPMPSLSPDAEQCIYRIAQEAIENVAYHANASQVSMRLEFHDTGLLLNVQDDGQGFDPRDKASTGHFGLVGMRERAELSGGKLFIESQKGSGTKVTLMLT